MKIQAESIGMNGVTFRYPAMDRREPPELPCSAGMRVAHERQEASGPAKFGGRERYAQVEPDP